ncbi:MAG: hypothetical protein AAFW00_23685 [Bacteroidota bacterium]
MLRDQILSFVICITFVLGGCEATPEQDTTASVQGEIETQAASSSASSAIHYVFWGPTFANTQGDSAFSFLTDMDRTMRVQGYNSQLTQIAPASDGTFPAQPLNVENVVDFVILGTSHLDMVKHNMDPFAAGEELTEKLNVAMKKGKRMVLLTPPVPDEWKDTPEGEDLYRYTAVVFELANSQNIPIMDLWTTSKYADESVWIRPGAFTLTYHQQNAQTLAAIMAYQLESGKGNK